MSQILIIIGLGKAVIFSVRGLNYCLQMSSILLKTQCVHFSGVFNLAVVFEKW